MLVAIVVPTVVGGYVCIISWEVVVVVVVVIANQPLVGRLVASQGVPPQKQKNLTLLLLVRER